MTANEFERILKVHPLTKGDLESFLKTVKIFNNKKNFYEKETKIKWKNKLEKWKKQLEKNKEYEKILRKVKID